MSHKITLPTGSQHTVSDADAGKISVAMQGVGLLAFDATLDGRKVFINASRVLLVESIDDEGEAAL